MGRLVQAKYPSKEGTFGVGGSIMKSGGREESRPYKIPPVGTACAKPAVREKFAPNPGCTRGRQDNCVLIFEGVTSGYDGL